MENRTYSEREVAAIIERAVERQEEARRARPEVGLSMEELERVAREVGIDAAHLRAAAAEVEAGGRVFGHTATQTDTHVVVERWVQGPLAVEGWEDAVAELQERFGADAGMWHGRSGGGVSQVGNTYEWTHTSHLGIQTRVTVSARGDRTRLRLTQLVGLAGPHVEGPAYGALITLVLGLFPAVVLFDGRPALIAFLTVLAFALYSGLVYVLDKKWRAKKLRQLDALADELAPRLAAPDAAPAGRVAEATPAPPVGASALDLDALADDTLPPGTESDPVRPRRRTRS